MGRRSVYLACVIAIGLATAALVVLHTPGFNGPPFFPYPWRTLPPGRLYLALAIGVVPFFLGQWIHLRWRNVPLALLAVMIGCFTLKLASIIPQTDPPGLEMIRLIVEDPDATSYYTDAAALNSRHGVREWLSIYHEYMPVLSLHSKTKAPGPILFFTALIKVFGIGEASALIGGILVGAIATLSILSTYWLLRILLEGDRDAAFHGASFLALCPGFVLFFPMFDPTYLILSCGLIGFWAIALKRNDWRWAAALGVMLAATCMISFNVLVIGIFMALYPLIALQGPIALRARVAAKLGAIAVITWIALLAMMLPVTGYDAVSTFITAWKNQHQLLERYAHTRPYPLTVPFDLSDFVIGSGGTSLALVLIYFARRTNASKEGALALLCIVQLVAVALTGLLQSETARVWSFMLPLWILPIAQVLRSCDPRPRFIVYAVTWLVLAAIAQNVGYIYVPPPAPPGL